MPTFASFDGVRLAYQVWEGSGGHARPVVLYHGFAANAEANWVRPGVVAALVDAGYPVVALDARGHGESEAPHDSSAYTADAMTKDVSALIDQLGADEVSLVGYSLGAVLALLVAGRDKRVRCLATGGVGSGVVDFGGFDGNVVTADDIAGALLADDPSDIPAAGAPFRALVDSVGSDRVALAAVIRADRPTSIDLTAITVPTLVLAGESDQLAAEPERLAAAIAGARLVRVPGDHLTAISRPEFTKALVDFLAT
ncbi:alpha/beta fold hydrolase [Amycolatopsis sp. CA-230715]|uniref:alpha/beta fold hydrolase n=1 Tax=Amycolatopsis sp. CA-230715 TaxID=2745196 RepID=UPI001C0214AC|nr:alpha/beta fold hydrolase [Amycolatopsis sp. CA-230715]QWF79711.1 Tropinesterase [Amycolatopsis sp. CA-230715]